jgi:NAD(P)-dependent dehydrogenase (short-subunit alcohol dehydrogenase family)
LLPTRLSVDAHLRRRKDPHDLVTLGRVWHRKVPGLAAYNVSKYGAIGLTEAIAVEGRPYDISAICLSPAAVDTEMLRRANPDLVAA